jgi:hypothetical protein
MQELPYEEILGWYEYFDKRPYNWQDDNRAAVIALSMSGSSKVKPQDLFASLKTISNQNKPNLAEQFFAKFGNRTTEKAWGVENV